MSNISEAIRRIGKELETLAEMLEADTPAEAAKPSKPPAEEKTPLPKLEDVRSVLAEISRQGKTAEMKQLLGRFGASKLSDIDPASYPALIAAAKEVQDA